MRILEIALLAALALSILLPWLRRGRARVARIVDDYTLAFFEARLDGASATLIEGSSPAYPQVALSARPAASGTP